jgi:uncharacterized membrane protein
MAMRNPLVPLKAIAVAGLLLAAAPAVAQGEAYHAAGTEPFWGLTIDARTMRFEAPDRATVSVRHAPRSSTASRARSIRRGESM